MKKDMQKKVCEHEKCGHLVAPESIREIPEFTAYYSFTGSNAVQAKCNKCGALGNKAPDYLRSGKCFCSCGGIFKKKKRGKVEELTDIKRV